MHLLSVLVSDKLTRMTSDNYAPTSAHFRQARFEPDTSHMCQLALSPSDLPCIRANILATA